MTGFDKQALLNLMAYPNEISDKELEDLEAILQEYPYFQLGHSLVAKAKHDKQTYDAHDALTHAAVYAPNRGLLRCLFYEDLKITPPFGLTDSPADNFTTDDSDTEVGDQQPETAFQPSASPSTPESYNPPYDDLNSQDDEQVIESNEVYNELEENLRKLRETKDRFSEEEEESKKKMTETSAEAQTSKKKTEQGTSPLLMELINEKGENHEPLVYGNSEQNELIDRFINSDNSDLLKARKNEAKKDEQPDDLSLNSVHISDDVITENLAEIYLRQDKKDKAIEIYHKLIWKFPQKKAYFAEIIENLKAQ